MHAFYAPTRTGRDGAFAHRRTATSEVETKLSELILVQVPNTAVPRNLQTGAMGSKSERQQPTAREVGVPEALKS
jgi:hypothetical protein